MLSLIKQVFIVLLSLESLAAKCLSLNDEPCIVRPTLIDLNLVEVRYYPFMINADKPAGSCNVLSPKICVPKETKHINVKAFNMITQRNEKKTIKIGDVNVDNKVISKLVKTKTNSTYLIGY